MALKVTSYILGTLISMGTWQPEEIHVRRIHENIIYLLGILSQLC